MALTKHHVSNFKLAREVIYYRSSPARVLYRLFRSQDVITVVKYTKFCYGMQCRRYALVSMRLLIPTRSQGVDVK